MGPVTRRGRLKRLMGTKEFRVGADFKVPPGTPRLPPGSINFCEDRVYNAVRTEWERRQGVWWRRLWRKLWNR